jgi:SM-20-related protein
VGPLVAVAVEPEHNRLVAFPAFVPHEVVPISCPGNAFADRRFSINCWLHRAR